MADQDTIKFQQTDVGSPSPNGPIGATKLTAFDRTDQLSDNGAMEREKIRITKEVDKPDANPHGRDGEESSPTSPLKSLPHDAAEIAATCAGRLTVAAVRQPLETFLCGAATGPIPGLEALAIAICREPKAFNLITVYAITEPDNPDGGSSPVLADGFAGHRGASQLLQGLAWYQSFHIN